MMAAMTTLTGADAIHMATVLEDCIDQLVILGRIMPVAYHAKPSAEQIVSDDISQLVESQKQLEAGFEDALNRKQATGSRSLIVKGDLQKATADLRSSAAVFALSLKQNPLSTDNFEKIQQDRSFLEEVLYNTMTEIKREGTFSTLTEAVRKEKQTKAQMEDIVVRAEESAKKIKELKKKIVEVKQERKEEIKQRSEMIAHLKDQLQEMKAKTAMEGKYVKKVCDVSVAQTQKRCHLTEKSINSEIEELKQKIDEENRVNDEIESFLRTHIEKRQDLLQFWVDKHETDVEQKQKELDLLKAAKAKDLERLQELTRLYAEYEQVVVEDRIEKEKARRRADLETRELYACIKIQAWWRGTMVRRCLGPYKKKKKKAGKGGKDEKKDGDKGKGKKK